MKKWLFGLLAGGLLLMIPFVSLEATATTRVSIDNSIGQDPNTKTHLSFDWRSLTLGYFSSHGDSSVDPTKFEGQVNFYLNYPTRRKVKIDFSRGVLSYQGNLFNDPATYHLSVIQDDNQQIKVYNWDGSGLRQENVSTRLSILGHISDSSRNTESAYLFLNDDGGVSLALPDFDNFIRSSETPIWLEYRLSGRYDGNDIQPTGKDQTDTINLAQPWNDLIRQIEVEFPMSAIDSLSFEGEILTDDEVIYSLFMESQNSELEYETYHPIKYAQTFIYEDYLEGYTQDQLKMMNFARLKFVKALDQHEKGIRHAENLRSTLEALVDGVYHRELVREDPVLDDIVNQISIQLGYPLQAYDLISLSQSGRELTIEVQLTEIFGSGVPFDAINLDTREATSIILGGGEEIIDNTCALRRVFEEIPFKTYIPKETIPATYKLDPEIIERIIK